MNSNEISGIETLNRQISLLKAEKIGREAELNQSFNELTQLIFNPVQNIPEGHCKKHKNKRELINLSKAILNRGTDYVIEQSFGKRQKLRGLLTSIIFEMVSNPLINGNIATFFSRTYNKLFGETDSNG
jgi:hypothetical protein